MDERGRPGSPARRTIFGISPVLLLGLGVIGVLVLAVAGLRRRPRPR